MDDPLYQAFSTAEERLAEALADIVVVAITKQAGYVIQHGSRSYDDAYQFAQKIIRRPMQ